MPNDPPANAPPAPPVAERPAFEIGFVLAGAVSAGCYSAGVMDFVIEALDDYYAERDKPGWDGPRHDVSVPVLAGASAGGMTAGMAALHMFRAFEHVAAGQAPPPDTKNRLYSSWVTDISIERLLETTDLDGNSDGLRSALCSTVLDKILADAFLIDGPAVQRRWVGRNGRQTLRTMVTMTNLRGVPYSFELQGAGASDAFGMTNHADVGSFRLGVGASPADRPWLDVTRSNDQDWTFFKTAVLATGAFPVGLAPRAIARPAKDFLTGGTVGRIGPDGRFQVIAPDSRFDITGTFRYWAVDGGTIDNEPLEQARRYLTQGEPDEPNGEKASRAVVLIAPFPNYKALDKDPVTGTLVTALPALFSGLIAQARFKPEELAKAQDETDFSRFLISPVRTRADGKPVQFDIASGALGGFSGFLHESFRRHDYLLGRRNAQAFLQWHFALPASNALFTPFAIDAKWLVQEPGTAAVAPRPAAATDSTTATFAPAKGTAATVPGYPIIPLTARLQQEIVIGPDDMAHPADVSLDDLKARLHTRIAAVVARLVDVDFRKETDEMGTIFGGLARKGAKDFGTQVASRKAEDVITKAIGDLQADFE